MTPESLKNEVYSCSSEIIGEIVFLMDVVRFREPAISLNLFDSQKKISLDFLCITAENVSYSEPGVIRVYDITCKCNKTHTGLQFSLFKGSTLGDVRYIGQIGDPRSSDDSSEDHHVHLELQLSDKHIDICAKSLLIHNGIIYLLSKLCELYLKRPLALTNIDIDYVNEEATLNDADSMCLLFSSPSLLRARAFSTLSTGASSTYSAHQAELDEALRRTVEEIESRNPSSSLNDIEQDMIQQIDKSEHMILDHLLQMEVSKNEAVNALLESVELAGKEVDRLENWLYKHNTKLGVMTHALQTITQENKSLGQQRKNHDRIQNTLQSVISMITISPETQAILGDLDGAFRMYFAECTKWSSEVQNGGLDNTFQHLPSANYLLRMQSVAEELQRISVAHQQVLCNYPISSLSAVQMKIGTNSSVAERFFTMAVTSIKRFISETEKSGITKMCQQITVLAPLLRVLRKYVLIC